MRRFPHLSLTVIMILGSTVLTSCRLGFDREAMLGRIADTVILPAHLALTEEAKDLDEVTRQFTEEPNAGTLRTHRSFRRGFYNYKHGTGPTASSRF